MLIECLLVALLIVHIFILGYLRRILQLLEWPYINHELLKNVRQCVYLLRDKSGHGDLVEPMD